MKHILLIITCLLLTKTHAQIKLSGRITQQGSGEALIGANIYLLELRRGTTTDANGEYHISPIPKGNYTVQISYISHKTLTQALALQQSLAQDFALPHTAIAIEEVIVSGSSTKTLIKESPIPISALSRTQWLQSGSTNLVDAISRLPGMSQITTGSTLSKPIIRGLGFNRVITMHDGVRQEDNQWGEEHSLHIDEYSIDRYEIIRGAGSLMYGSDGIGGVMSVISPLPIEEGKTQGNILYNYQTNNAMSGVSANLAGNSNGFIWSGRISMKDAKNYQNPADGRVFGSNFNELNYSGMLGINRKWGYSRLYFSKFGQKINIIDGLRNERGKFVQKVFINNQEKLQEVTEHELESRTINPANSQNLSNYKISSNNLYFFDKTSLSLNIAYAQNHRKEYGNIQKPLEPDLYFFLQNLYYDVRYNFAENNGWETTLGSNGMWQSMQNQGNETLYPNFNLQDKGIFIFSKKKLHRWIMSGGLRFDHRNLEINKLYVDQNGKFQTHELGAVEERFSGLQKSYANLTGSFGAVWKVTDKLSVKANLARGFRAPSVPELASNGEHAGTFRYEKGNVNQQSEVSLQSDLGITWESSSLYVDFNIFRNHIQHYTYSERVQNTSGKDSTVAGVPVFQYVQGNALLWGIEGSITFNPESARWLSFTQSYSMVNGQNQQANNDSLKYLPFMPPPRWISQVKLTKNSWGNHIKNLYIMAEWEYNQTQNQVLLAYNTETPTPSYQLLNIGMGTSIINRQKKTLMSIYISANNLLDTIYQSHQSRLKYLEQNQVTGRAGVFNMGRNISIKLLVPIDF
jgi:iron complex outermembrane receptor protein